MFSHFASAFTAFIGVPCLAFTTRRSSFLRVWACSAAGGTGFTLAGGDRVDALFYAAAFVIALMWDWWNRKGRRVAKAVGAKSKAVIDGMIRRVRESAPAPVPQGVPG